MVGCQNCGCFFVPGILLLVMPSIHRGHDRIVGVLCRDSPYQDILGIVMEAIQIEERDWCLTKVVKTIASACITRKPLASACDAEDMPERANYLGTS